MTPNNYIYDGRSLKRYSFNATMILLVLLIYFSTLHIFIGETYAPASDVIGKVDVKTLLKQESITSVKLKSEDSYLNITQLARKYGYRIEEHKVVTEDGYILGLHRLVDKNNDNFSGVPVLLMHGLLDSSDSWILQGPNTALGYLLVNKGFDVWMGNARGNKYSNAHTILTPNQEIFWKFSWEEIGVYDLPAMIDYILKITDKNNIYYVGYSQGTTSFFVMNSLKPEYAMKIKTMFALAPVAWLSHSNSPMLKYLSNVPATVMSFFQYLNTPTPSTDFLSQVYSNMCKVASKGCGNIFEMLFGTNYFVSNALLPVIVEHATSSSVLQLVHYWQLHHSTRFCRFDYGWMRNLLYYGTFSPPDYDLTKTTVPVVMFFSSNDWLSQPSDVTVLINHLPNVHYGYYSQYFSHIDYIYASVAKDAVYEKIVKHIQDCECHNCTHK